MGEGLGAYALTYPSPQRAPPHCRDAPWGVSAAAISPQKSQGVRGRPGVFRSDRRHLASDRPSSSWIVGAASETPHGASLQWGAPAVPGESPQTGLKSGDSMVLSADRIVVLLYN